MDILQQGYLYLTTGLPGGQDGKESACSARDLGSIPRSGRSHGGGHGNPLQYSCLANPMDRGVWRATVLGIAKSQTPLKQLSTQHTHMGSKVGFLVAQIVKNLPAVQETWVRSHGQEDPLEKGMAIHSSILAWRIP